ncbi:hypothetical protein C0J52_26169 [Blattella germanica]|nr:hypothetical protein C0J52_26169 [Blattella germanica]
MLCSFDRIMTNLQEWHQALGLVPVAGDKSIDMPKKKYRDWETQVANIEITEKDDISRRRERNKLRMRQVRALENVEEADRRREKNKLRMRQVRALENEQEAEKRREKNKLRMRQVRAIEKMDNERSLEYSMSEISMVPTQAITEIHSRSNGGNYKREESKGQNTIAPAVMDNSSQTCA